MMKKENSITNPIISVIVPVFAVEKYIRKCIQSVVSQDCIDYEIVLVDDGSPDNCGEICDEYASKYNNIVAIHKENGGLSDARNAGVKAAKGEYVVFVDSDDYVDCDYLSTLWTLHVEYSAEITFSAAIKEDELGKKLNRVLEPKEISLSKRDAQAMILKGELIGTSACGKLFKKSICEKHPFPKGELMEDLRTVYFMLEEVETVGISTKQTYHYIQREGSILHGEYGIDDAKEYISIAENFIKIAPTQQVRNASLVRLLFICGVLMKGATKSERNRVLNYIRGIIYPNLKHILTQKDISLKKKIQAIILCLPNRVIIISLLLKKL